MFEQIPDISFDPVACADLHNQLLAKAISPSNSTAVVQRDLISRIEEASLHWPNKITIPSDSLAYQFLSLIDTIPGTSPVEVPLTPSILQPNPDWFDDKGHQYDREDGWNYILLYPEVDLGKFYGGLFFDLDTNKVIFRSDFARTPGEEYWVPLEVALREELRKWEEGKYHWDVREGCHEARLSKRSWTSHDLELTVAAWGQLLDTIEERLPDASDSSARARYEPLAKELVTKYQVSSFTAAFLTKAKRPSFSYVAPGITTFSPETFEALYDEEDPKAWRVTWMEEEEEECSSLVLPAADGVVPRNVPELLNRHFDRDYGNAKLTVSRHAGLYTEIRTAQSDGDDVWLLTPEGLDDVFRHVIQLPWGPNRGYSLAEILWYWTWLVEQEIWEVGADGITTPSAWFADPSTESYRRTMWMLNPLSYEEGQGDEEHAEEEDRPRYSDQLETKEDL